MTQQPDFIEFAAIQIFAAMVGDPRRSKSFHEDAAEAWRVAKVLYEAKPQQEEQGIKPQMDVICARMQKESDLAWTWHCNVAMAFVDEGGDRESANRAAARFMFAAFGVDTSQSDEWKQAVEPYIQPKRFFQAVVDEEGNHALYENEEFCLKLVAGEFYEDDLLDVVQRKLTVPIGTSLNIHFNYISVDVVSDWPKSLNEALLLDQ